MDFNDMIHWANNNNNNYNSNFSETLIWAKKNSDAEKITFTDTVKWANNRNQDVVDSYNRNTKLLVQILGGIIIISIIAYVYMVYVPKYKIKSREKGNKSIVDNDDGDDGDEAGDNGNEGSEGNDDVD